MFLLMALHMDKHMKVHMINITIDRIRNIDIFL